MDTATKKLGNDHVHILRLIDVMEKMIILKSMNIDHFETVVNLIKDYADGFHHAKEENLFSPLLSERGFSIQQGPVAVMLNEHVQGRNYVKGISEGIVLLKEGKDLAIIACGAMVYEALLACEELAKEGIRARLINLHTIKPLDKETILKAAEETKAVVTAEEHLLSGGLGGAVAEFLSQNHPVPIKMVGINDRFGESGKAAELFKAFNLTAHDIVKAAKDALKIKK